MPTIGRFPRFRSYGRKRKHHLQAPNGDSQKLTAYTFRLTNFNVAISVLSLFVLLAKLISFIMKVYYPVIGVFASFAMTALYATSVYGQAGPDYADSRYPSPVAWYIRKSCDPARPWNAYKSCQLAKGSFAVTVYLLYVPPYLLVNL